MSSKSVEAVVAAALALASCATIPDPREMAKACDVKYRVSNPAAANVARASPDLRLDAGLRAFGPGVYACVVATITASGELRDAKVVEASQPAFGEYFLEIVKRGHYVAATSATGEPLTTTAVMSASSW